MQTTDHNDTAPTPERFNDCPRTTAAMRYGDKCKAHHLYTTADFSDKLERELSKTIAERDSALAKLATAEAECAALRKDKERVDALQVIGFANFNPNSGMWDVIGKAGTYRGPTLRAAIDAALAQPSEPVT